jgi:hypothetical protein
MPIIGPDKGKPKGIAALIVEGMGKPSTMNEGAGDYMEAGRVAMLDLINAIEAKEAGRAYMAYKKLHEICDAQLESEEGEEEGSESEYGE